MASQSTPSTTREALLKTTHHFLSTFQSTTPSPSTPTMDPSPLFATTAPSYTHTMGPKHFVERSPHLQSSKTAAEFAQHLERMTALFDHVEYWVLGEQEGDPEGAGVVVDEVKRVVVCSVVHKMVVKAGKGEDGDGEEGREKRTVCNEVTWWFWFSEEGLVERTREVLDASAAVEIARLMEASVEGA